MGADILFETSANNYQNTRRYISENSDMYNHKLEDLSSPKI